jgi:hypothetical protein
MYIHTNDFHEDVPYEHDDQDLIVYKMYLCMPFKNNEILKIKNQRLNYIRDKCMQNVYHPNVLTYVFCKVNV